MRARTRSPGLHWAVLRVAAAISKMEIDDFVAEAKYDGGCGQVPVTGPIT